MHPIRCPTSIADSPAANPSGAKYVPVSISAKDTPAPNHIRPFSNIDVRLSFSVTAVPPRLFLHIRL